MNAGLRYRLRPEHKRQLDLYRSGKPTENLCILDEEVVWMNQDGSVAPFFAIRKSRAGAIKEMRRSQIVQPIDSLHSIVTVQAPPRTHMLPVKWFDSRGLEVSLSAFWEKLSSLICMDRNNVFQGIVSLYESIERGTAEVEWNLGSLMVDGRVAELALFLEDAYPCMGVGDAVVVTMLRASSSERSFAAGDLVTFLGISTSLAATIVREFVSFRETAVDVRAKELIRLLRGYSLGQTALGRIYRILVMPSTVPNQPRLREVLRRRVCLAALRYHLAMSGTQRSSLARHNRLHEALVLIDLHGASQKAMGALEKLRLPGLSITSGGPDFRVCII